MDKHTPGPWSFDTDGVWIDVCGPNGETIARFRRYVQQGNYRLIAAAPELLEALRHIANFTAYQDCDNCSEMNVVAREAIAKATGA